MELPALRVYIIYYDSVIIQTAALLLLFPLLSSTHGSSPRRQDIAVKSESTIQKDCTLWKVGGIFI